jgi:4-aminobutyrate aminotransferase-like enzyme
MRTTIFVERSATPKTWGRQRARARGRPPLCGLHRRLVRGQSRLERKGDLRALAPLQRPRVDIRVTGLAIGLEFKEGAYAGALADRCRKRGLILSIDDDTLTLFPALTISRSVVHEGLDILERCL